MGSSISSTRDVLVSDISDQMKALQEASDRLQSKASASAGVLGIITSASTATVTLANSHTTKLFLHRGEIALLVSLFLALAAIALSLFAAVPSKQLFITYDPEEFDDGDIYAAREDGLDVEFLQLKDKQLATNFESKVASAQWRGRLLGGSAILASLAVCATGLAVIFSL